MKTIWKVLLVVVIAGLAYVAVESIMKPIRFKNEREAREKAIIARLIDIRKAQIAYKQAHNVHAATFEELVAWLNTGNIPTVRKEGELTEKQLEEGMTEAKAAHIVALADRTGNWKEAEAAGLSSIINGERVSFRRDTTWGNAAIAIFGEGYNIAELGKVPGTDVTFDMDTASVVTASEISIKVFEASVPYTKYLADLDKQEVDNLIDIAKTINRFPGLKVGALTEINNNAGNWE